MYVTESVYIIGFTEFFEVKIFKLKKNTFSYIPLDVITNNIFRCNQTLTAQGQEMPVHMCVCLSDSNITQWLYPCQINLDIYWIWASEVPTGPLKHSGNPLGLFFHYLYQSTLVLMKLQTWASGVLTDYSHSFRLYFCSVSTLWNPLEALNGLILQLPLPNQLNYLWNLKHKLLGFKLFDSGHPGHPFDSIHTI